MMKNLEREIEILRYHQYLLLNIIRNPKAKFDLLIVEKNLTEEEVQEIIKLCEMLSNKLSIEKAEGYMNFQPLFSQLERNLPPQISVKELMDSFLSQGLFLSLMQEISKFCY